MLRRPPTTLKLTQDDVSELIAELEEEKLQQRIQSQRKNLIRSSTRVDIGKRDDGRLSEPPTVDTNFQISPLDGKRLALELSDGPPRANSQWSNNHLSKGATPRENAEGATLNNTSPNTEGNPFYNQG
ncbi:uncharacterized protein ZBAI_00854 [Zygosaccharomyces bailii ISA1307]|nr:uncharacterized protein ZBAI_00854 [Zygosaccharomyces bailii ISA1307]